MSETTKKKKIKFDRENREKVKKVVKKVISISRAGLELYFSVKKKDPIMLGLGLLSTCDALENVLTKEGETLHERLTKMGVSRVAFGMERLIYDTLTELQIPYEVIVMDKSGGATFSIVMFNIYETKVYILAEGNYIGGVYSICEDLFIESFSKLLREKLGEIVSINVYRENWETKIKLSSTEIPLDTYICPIDIQEYCETINKFKNMGLNRSSLLFGKPGSGKTSFSAKVAKTLNGRLVIIDAQALIQATNQGWNLIFQKIIRLLSPTVVLFDDIDRLGEDTLGTLLRMVEDLNRYKGDNVVIMASVNDLSRLPDAMKRPGRFDEITVFEEPNDEERRNILQTYLKHFKMRLADNYVDEMVELTEGLAPAYLREIALQATITSYNRIPKIIAHIKNMLSVDKEVDEPDMPSLNGIEMPNAPILFNKTIKI